MKHCFKCNLDKDTNEFNKCNTKSIGFQSWCKDCCKKHRQENYKKSESKTEKDLIFSAGFKKCCFCDEFKSIEMFGKSKNRYGGIRSDCKQCRSIKDNHFKRKGYKDDWYKNNRLKVLSNCKKRSLTQSFKETRKKLYVKNKPQFLWRSVLRGVITRLKINKNGKTKELLGYGPEELKAHIESLWTSGMSWENHGEWHLDHIQPVCTFPLNSKISDVNALSNLQPLWATTRIINGVKFIGNLNKSKKEF